MSTTRTWGAEVARAAASQNKKGSRTKTKGFNMRVVAVCGMGIGTSVMLKMNIETALGNLGVDDIDVEAADISTAKGAASGADLVLTSDELADQLGDVDVPVVVVDNFFDLAEITEKLEAQLD